MNLELREVAMPTPGPNQLLVKIHASSLNRGELIAGHGLIAAGAAKPGGQEAAGVMVSSGQKVMGRCPGGFAEFALMDASDAIPIPPNLSWEEAGAIPLAFLVVHDMLVGQGNLKAGEWLLVTGVSSGVGVAAFQAAKAIGARVIGTSGSAEKLGKLKALGLDVAIQTRNADFQDAVMKVTGGKGVDLVVNNVGGSVFAECIRVLGYQGRLATVGYLDRVMKAEIDIDALHSRRLRLFGVSNKYRNAEQRAVTVRGFTADFLPYFASGRIKPLIDRVYGFDQLPEAKAFVESDAQLGKVVVKI
jgi:NADPH:quinone reductase-like Zn-dependent oxidoreductase